MGRWACACGRLGGLGRRSRSRRSRNRSRRRSAAVGRLAVVRRGVLGVARGRGCVSCAVMLGERARPLLCRLRLGSRRRLGAWRRAAWLGQWMVLCWARLEAWLVLLPWARWARSHRPSRCHRRCCCCWGAWFWMEMGVPCPKGCACAWRAVVGVGGLWMTFQEPGVVAGCIEKLV